MAQTINVDISTRGAPPVAYTHQGDTDRTFLVNLFENGEDFAVAGFTVKVAAILPGDGGYTVISGADMVSATKTTTGTNQIMFTPSAQYTARSGRGILTLIMTTNTGTPATLRPINIDFRIQKSADGEDVIAGASDFPEGLEAIAESVFQEYLSTYLPPVAPSSSADANKAASAKLTGEELSNLKSDLNDLSESVDTGILETTKEVSWINAYVNTGGVITNSSASRTGLVTLNAGDTVKIGTRNANITIIGSTNSDSIAVGDRVTPIEKTSSVDQYEEHTYTATSTINIVVCVRASEYNLSFYKITDVYKEVRENTENLESIAPVLNILSAQNFVSVTRPLVINGMLDTTTGKRTFNLSQVNSYCITPDLLHVAKGSDIVKSSSVTMRVYFYNEDDTFIEYTQIGTGTTKYTFTNDCYARLFFLIQGETNTKTVYDNVTFNLVLYGYEPYSTFTFLGLSGESPNIHSSTSGDASLIQFSNGKVMEIDFHRDDQNNYQYYRDALSIRGIKRLDYIVFTHWHDDHWGLFDKALEYGYINIDGATAFLPQELTTELVTQRGWESYKQKQDEIITILENHNCTIVRPQNGDKLKIDDVEIEWYNCDHSVYNTSGDYYSTNYNDWSLCFNLRKQNTVINYSADLGPVGQRYNAGKLPKCTILKAMHHGWDNGVNNLIPAFINNISPNIVIAENGYEHRPNSGLDSSISNAKSPIYSWAEANGVPAYPTNTNGNIDVVVNNYGYRLNGHYTRFIRNDKNWSYTDNSEHIET